MDYSFLIGVHKKSYDDEQKEEVKKEEVTEGDSKKLLPERISLFKTNQGGVESVSGHELYFLTIIDIFTVWNVKKRMEHSFKSLVHEANAISAVHPTLYRERFLSFLEQRFE